MKVDRCAAGNHDTVIGHGVIDSSPSRDGVCGAIG